MPRNKCLALLARREYSKLELKQRLLAKGFELESILAAIAVLAEENLQSDERYAESFVRYRQAMGKGPLKIRYELLQKGVEPSLIEKALMQFDWCDVCLCVLEKRFEPELDLELNFTEKVALERFLLGRGFSKTHIKDAMKLIKAR